MERCLAKCKECGSYMFTWADPDRSVIYIRCLNPECVVADPMGLMK